MTDFFGTTSANTNFVAKQRRAHQLELNSLLANVKKSIELWFLTGMRQKKATTVYDQVMATCVEVLRHGFQLKDSENAAGGAYIIEKQRKLYDDFEWLRRSAQIRESLALPKPSTSKHVQPTRPAASPPSTATVEQFLCTWTLRNLKANCLCACLQALIAEKELLELYYPTPDSFLRNECYATALFICLSALELNQYSLLSQIDVKLYASSNTVIGTRHRRTNSHPNFSISPPKAHVASLSAEPTKWQKLNVAPRLPTFRKVKSQPQLQVCAEWEPRQRSKTLGAAQKINTRFAKRKLQTENSTIAIAKSPCASNSTLNSDSVSSLATTIKDSASSGSSLISGATTSTTSTQTARRIELIKCDDIKIWTDHNWEQEQQQKLREQQQSTTIPCTIPQTVRQAKSISPIHSFLTNLFGTPPGYTAWSLHQSDVNAEFDSANEVGAGAALTASDSFQLPAANVVSDNASTSHDCSSKMGSVFESFLPIYGKKLRSRKSQCLFETGVSSLDYSLPNCNTERGCAAVAASSSTTNETSAGYSDISAAPKNCESLMAYLQMAQLSRNNTELEKENAHFRISEAIISAIEHIKWARAQAGELSSSPTAIATDWLQDAEQQQQRKPQVKVTDAEAEHIPYAEVGGQVCTDQLSAEVVGLTLLAKFNDKQLPKVSELKWLVSEEDAPQQLLPLPDTSRNPDDTYVPPMMRGTRYWAPPRPQIIFTDHPPPNRKQLVLKQNNRCAGCGMVVSPQFVHSFRYCTYLGKYHCTGCHRNQMSVTPAKILQNWDFKCYPVSVFAYRLLEQMHNYPLFYVPDLNAALYVRQSALLTARRKRLQLRYVRDFIRTCRFATREQQYFEAVPSHLTADPDIWSMSDFVDARNKSLQRSIDDLIERCENHIFHCVLCTARGFLCEHCQKDEIIYPWQSYVHRCDCCGACFHQKCWNCGISGICMRCQRFNKRQSDDADTVAPKTVGAEGVIPES